MRRDSPEGKVEVFRCLLLVLAVSDDDVSTLAAKSGDDSLEARVFACWVDESLEKILHEPTLTVSPSLNAL